MHQESSAAEEGLSNATNALDLSASLVWFFWVR